MSLSKLGNGKTTKSMGIETDDPRLKLKSAMIETVNPSRKSVEIQTIEIKEDGAQPEEYIPRKNQDWG